MTPTLVWLEMTVAARGRVLLGLSSGPVAPSFAQPPLPFPCAPTPVGLEAYGDGSGRVRDGG